MFYFAKIYNKRLVLFLVLLDTLHHKIIQLFSVLYDFQTDNTELISGCQIITSVTQSKQEQLRCVLFSRLGPAILNSVIPYFPFLQTQNDGFVLVFSVTYYRLFEILFPLS